MTQSKQCLIYSMDIFKIVGIAFVGGLLSLFLRGYKKEFALVCSIVTALIILIAISDTVIAVLDVLFSITQKSGVDKVYFEIIIKVVGIAYITQYGGELLKDSGENAIAQKVYLAGKLSILYVTIPVVKGFLEVCIETMSFI